MGDEHTLEPLRCHQCGEPLALADAASVKCPGCGATTAVPELHRAALRAEQEDARIRRTTAGVRALGTMPSWPLRVLGTMFAGWKRLALGAYLVATATMAVTLLGVVAMEALFHVNVFMTVRTELRDIYGIPIWVTVVLLTVALGVYGQRRAVSLRGVQAALAARPPLTPGGPAICRHCGAPLSVPPDAVDVRCIFCSTDNLVALSSAWVHDFTASAGGAARELATAQDAFRAQTKRLRRRMLITLGCYAAGLGLFIAVSARHAYAHRPDEIHDPRWWEHDAMPRDLVRRHPTRDGSGWHLGAESLAFARACTTQPTTVALAPDDCDAAGCTLWLYAALREHERASLVVTGIASPGAVDVAAPRWFAGWSHSPKDAFRARAGSFALQPARPTAFVADWRTWYELAVHLPHAAPGPIGVCFWVEP